jgi:MFS family permease
MPRLGRVRALGDTLRSEPAFRRVFLAQFASLIGDMMAPVALTFALLAHGTVTDVGLVLACETLAATVFVLFGGAIADRYARRDVLVATDCVRAVSQGASAWIILSGDAGVLTLAPLAALNGASMALFRPALTALIPVTVRPANLTAANSALGMAASTGTLLGPALAGVIIGLASPGWAIAGDAVTYALSGVLLLPLGRTARGQASAGMTAEIVAGWRYVRRTPWIGPMIAYAGLFQAVTLSALYVLGPLVAEEEFGGAPGWSALLVALGAGSLLGGVVAVVARPRLPLLAAVAGMSVFVLPLVSLIPPLPLPIVLIEMVACGVALTAFDAWWLTALQTHVPDDLLGKVSSIDWFGSITLRPLGLALTGAMAGVVGAEALFAAAAALFAAGTLGTLSLRSIRTFNREPDKDDESLEL